MFIFGDLWESLEDLSSQTPLLENSRVLSRKALTFCPSKRALYLMKTAFCLRETAFVETFRHSTKKTEHFTVRLSKIDGSRQTGVSNTARNNGVTKYK